MPYWCPNEECETEITHLNYRADVVEYGSYYIRNGDMDCNDSDTQNITYTCPECDEELDTDDVLDEDPNEGEEEVEEIISETEKAERNTRVIDFHNKDAFCNKNNRISVNIIKCNKCSHMFNVEDNDMDDLTCTKCAQTITSKEKITI